MGNWLSQPVTAPVETVVPKVVDPAPKKPKINEAPVERTSFSASIGEPFSRLPDRSTSAEAWFSVRA